MLRQSRFTLIVSLCLAAAISAFPAQAQNTPPVRLDRGVTPPQGEVNKAEFEVTLTMLGRPEVCPPPPPLLQSDIVLVMDKSGSMSGPRLAALKSAAKVFLTKVDFANDQVSLVEFSDGAFVSQSFSKSSGALSGSIDAIQAGGGTSIAEGIEFANREFDSARARTNVNRIMIVLSDGEDPSPIVPAKATEAEVRGIRIISIALGAEAGRGALRAIASQPSDFYDAPNPEDLENIYAKLATTFSQKIAAADVVVEQTINTSAYRVLPDSISPGGRLETDKVVWRIPRLLSKEQRLSYRVVGLAPGNSSNISRGDTVRYRACNSTPEVANLPAGMPVTVLPPPTPTTVPRASPLPTPQATFTPAPPPAVPLPPAAPSTSLLNLLCSIEALRTLIALLAIPALLWALYQIWRTTRMPNPADRRCSVALWLLLPALLLLLSALLGRVLGLACLSGESLYFWKIPQSTLGGGAGRVYVTDKEGLRPAREFDAISQGNCTGCHSVSSASKRIAAVSDGGSGPLNVYGLDGQRINIPQLRASFSAWSPDGTRIAVTTEQMDIVIVDVEKGTVTPLQGASDPVVGEAMASWSADGKAIAFARGARFSTAFQFEGRSDIYVVPAAGGVAQAFPGASGNGLNYYPAFSPDGRWLAFTRNTRGTTTYAAPEAEIFLVPATGGLAKRITANDAASGAALADVSNSWATWSLDGKKLAFTSKRDDPKYDVFVTAIDPATGDSGIAAPVKTAAIRGDFEHLPFWGVPPEPDIVGDLLALWPWLLPVLLVLALWWLLCKLWSRRVDDRPPVMPPSVPPDPLPVIKPDPLWQVAPTLFIGYGGTGRWTLTHLKKTLRDAGGGVLPKGVRFLLLDTAEREVANVYRDADNNVTTVAFADVTLDADETVLMNVSLKPIIDAGPAADRELSAWFPYDSARYWPVDQRDLAQGTHGRRPVARAGLIAHLRQSDRPESKVMDGERVLGISANALWSLLMKSCQDARDERFIRIVVAGSTAGGMSGVLCDIGYLARIAAQKTLEDAQIHNGVTQVDVYLATHEVFLGNGAEVNRERLAQTAAATTRELERFQMAANWPIVFDYRASLDGPTPDATTAFNKVCGWQLFDDVNLFGRQLARESGASAEGWASTFATMADVIAQRSDRAVVAGNGGERRSRLRAQAVPKQNAAQTAMVSASGSMSHRVPVMDIIEIVKTQWARKLLYTFLNGGINEASVSFDPSHAGLSEAPDAAGRRFILGHFEAAAAPDNLYALEGLLSRQADARSVVDLAVSVTRESDTFQRYLQNTLALLLNGTQGDADSGLIRRAPRIGYARAVIAAARADLAGAMDYVHEQKAIAPQGAASRSLISNIMLALGTGRVTVGEWEALGQRFEEWDAVLMRSGKSLDQMRNSLIGREGTDTVFSSVDRAQRRAEERRRQMDLVGVRKYYWDDAAGASLVETAFRRADGELSTFLGRMRWEVAADGGIRFGLITDGKLVPLQEPNEHGEIPFVDELMRMAGWVARKALGALTLATVFDLALPGHNQDEELSFVARAWEQAQPPIRPPAGPVDIDGLLLAEANVPDAASLSPKLATVVDIIGNIGPGRANRLPAHLLPVEVNVTRASDLTSLLLVRRVALMPMARLEDTRAAFASYCRLAGSEWRTEAEPSLTTPVFANEALALQYETRLESQNPRITNLDFHALHPYVVIGIQDALTAQAYALAYAAGWINQAGRALSLQIPGGNLTPLGDMPNLPGLNRGPAGLLLLHSSDAAMRATFREAVQQRIRTQRPENDWFSYLQPYLNGELDPRTPALDRDFGAFVALETYRVIDKAANRDNWAGMAARQMRNCG